MRSNVPIERVEVRAYRIPTDQPESDGTYRWDSTTLLVVQIGAGGMQGLGYSYADQSAAILVREKLAKTIQGRDAMNIGECWGILQGSVRNLGEPGICMLAISAMDAALWDLKAKLLDLPLARLLGSVREDVDIYGSGGFTSYTVPELQRQLGTWVDQGISRVKMKIGTNPAADPERVEKARIAIGNEAELFVDANGAYSCKEALAMAEVMMRHNVTWFEEPVVHHDREGLRYVRDRLPAKMEVSAGEYGFTIDYFLHLLQEGAVDVLQADATRCGITGFLEAAALCEAFHVPLSSHCAPALHLHLGCATKPFRHLEYFHDHVRIERMLFEGVVEPVNGALRPDLSRPGIGLELKEEAAHRFEL